MSTSIIPIGTHTCAYCGPHVYHSGLCPKMWQIEHYADGTVRRVTFHGSQTYLASAGLADVRKSFEEALRAHGGKLDADDVERVLSGLEAGW